ncbi:MAG TPA: glycoside hydrolase family 2 TIM barrel-domain containing protein [Baekduia sp.]|uniref:glycoside hydrolase family 2 protein n=1 Tax=Baekduia sp. TaxID=2600305 RepID=UPI002D7869F3|nr:glycoside hydrolase family 2 TIM barrel-domain containing protein [Baekduia sp.]HET6505743.1 glycoside hydrolase family 2 TIM barrel-domain containing protein [Baekduia sp.]
MTRWLSGLVALALVALAAGLAAGARARPDVPAAASPRVDPAHPPVAFGGPDGRRALDGAWVVSSRRGGPGRRAHLPYSPNARSLTLSSYAGAVAWYRTVVGVRGGVYALRFESVNHRATVWVDGRVVARHVGDALPFEARVRLARGHHRVEVRADWRDPDAMKATGWHRAWFNFGGIDREVTIRRVGGVEVEAPSIVTRLERGDTAVVDVAARVRGGRATRVAGSLGGTPLSFGAVGPDGVARARLRIAHPALWSPGHPALHVLHVEAGGSGWTERVGLRELRWDGGKLRVNGRALTLHGASLQEDAPGRGTALRPSDMDRLVSRLKAIGANATRAQHPLSPALLERLDAAGILVWQEIGPMEGPGNWTSTTPALRRAALRRDRIAVEQERTHPSILAWNLANEAAHQGHDGGQAAYTRAAARLVHQLDPGRPVALDVWGRGLPANDRGPMYEDIDVFGVTMYEGWYERPGEPRGDVIANLRRRLAVAHAIFRDRVLVVTEFGAEANRSNPSGAPGSEDYQARLIGDQIRVLRADPRLSGWLVWALQDFALTPTFGGGSVRHRLPSLRLVPGLNQKGLFTYDGDPKPAAAVVRALSR